MQADEFYEYLKSVERTAAHLSGRRLIPLTGSHRSRRYVPDFNIADRRAYVPGDDLRYGDWKLLARTSKLYIKLGQAHSMGRTIFILDNSASMFHPQAIKYQNSALVLMGMAYLAFKAGDRVLCSGLYGEIGKNLGRPIRKKAAFYDIYSDYRSLGSRDAGKKPLADELFGLLKLIPANSNVYLFSDLYMPPDLLKRWLLQLARRQIHGMIIHCHTSDEMYAATQDSMENWIDSESGKRLYLTDTDTELTADRIRRAVERRRQLILNSGHSYTQYRAEKPPLPAVQAMLRRP